MQTKVGSQLLSSSGDVHETHSCTCTCTSPDIFQKSPNHLQEYWAWAENMHSQAGSIVEVLHTMFIPISITFTWRNAVLHLFFHKLFFFIISSSTSTITITASSFGSTTSALGSNAAFNTSPHLDHRVRRECGSFPTVSLVLHLHFLILFADITTERKLAGNRYQEFAKALLCEHRQLVLHDLKQSGRDATFALTFPEILCPHSSTPWVTIYRTWPVIGAKRFSWKSPISSHWLLIFCGFAATSFATVRHDDDNEFAEIQWSLQYDQPHVYACTGTTHGYQVESKTWLFSTHANPCKLTCPHKLKSARKLTITAKTHSKAQNMKWRIS